MVRCRPTDGTLISDNDDPTFPGMPAVEPDRPSARRALILCTTPRTGSKLLCDALWRTRIAGKPDEYFAPELGLELKRAAGGKGAGGDAAFVREVVKRAMTPNGIISIKVHWHHMENVRRYLVAPGGPDAGTSLAPFAQLAEVVDYCWLRRRDVVRQAISLFRALSSGRWQSTQSRNASPEGLEFDYPKIKKLVARIAEWNASWERHFVEVGITPIPLHYEDDLEHDFRPTVLRIFRVLGVEVPDDQALEPGSARQSDATSEEWVRRYHAAAADPA